MICHNLIILTKLHFSIHWQLLNWTVNNNYMTLLRALHHTHDGFWYFFRCFKSNTHSWYTSNFKSANKEPSFIRVAAFVILVSNYYSYKEKTIKLLPYHSFYGGHIPLRKIEPSFLAVHLKKIQSHKDPHLAAFS